MKNHLIVLILIAFLLPQKTDALIFDGVDDYVNTGNPASIYNASALTVSMWVKIAPTAAVNAAYHKEKSPAASGDFGFTVRSDRTRFYIRTTGVTYQQVDSLTQVDDGQWHYLVARWTGSQIQIFTDGVSTATPVSTTGTIADNGQNLLIGNSSFGTTPFKGLIDEVRVYNRALTATEIRGLYYSFGTRTGLVAYWPLWGGSLPFVPDLSGSRNHASAVGGPVVGPRPPVGRYDR